MNAPDRAIRDFRSRFGTDPTVVVRSPGRINIIGEHTDYNDGFVLPMAIDRDTVIAARPRNDRSIVVSSEGHGTAIISLDDLPRPSDVWSDYVSGTAWALGDDVQAFECVVTSDLPIGASVSSSASFEMGLLRVHRALGDGGWDPVHESKLGQRVENEWFGLQSGILDQLAVSCGVEGQAVLIDCRSLDVKTVPMPADASIVLLDTSTRRKLTESRYNDRRKECEQAAERIGVESLRDAGIEAARELRRTDEILGRRAFHIVSENERTLAAASAMHAGDDAALGRLMSESHASLRDDFEVSGPELDAMVEAAQDSEGCLGARMTGGGFAGCAIALVANRDLGAFLAEAQGRFELATELEPELHVCGSAHGTTLIG